VDEASDGDVIRVAAGTYTDIHSILHGMDPVTYVVNIDKNLTVRGGYTTTDDFADPPDPDSNPTTLDAGGQGKVVYLYQGPSYFITVTLEGLQMTNGVASGTGVAASSGGGIFAEYAHVTISGCQVFSNSAQFNGGGIYVKDGSNTTLIGNQVYSNTAASLGGGIYLSGIPFLTLSDNHVYANDATSGSGGGVYISSSPIATVSGNHVYGNTGQGGGGTVLTSSPTSTVSSNLIYSNTSTFDGGGVYIAASHNTTLSDNDIYHNVAGGSSTTRRGGGVYIDATNNTRLTSNRISSNTIAATTNARGGGIHIRNSSVSEMSNNEIISNTASSPSARGGGIYIYNTADVTLTGNDILNNSSDGATTDGGGLFIESCPDLTLTGNDISHNTASNYGGGTSLGSSDRITIVNNVFYDNSGRFGGGLEIDQSSDVVLYNNMVAENRVGEFGLGAGVYIWNSEARFLHTTVASNGVYDVEGIYAGMGNTLWLTNTIIVDHYTGIAYGGAGTAVTVTYTLWGTGAWDNTRDWYNPGGSGTIYTGTQATNWWELPGFVDPGNGDYHIGAGSGALDRGLATGLDFDIDNEARPFCSGIDLGADENGCCTRVDASLYPTVQDGIRAANSGDVIEVAGTCRGVDSHSALAYITESVTIRGGYAGDFGAWDPDTYPTTLDAQGQGRVVYFDWIGGGHMTPTLEILRLTNGSTTGPGGGIYVEDSSGYWTHPVISGCVIYGNASDTGAGVGLYFTSDSRLVGNSIYNNSASGGTPFGGGIFLHNATNATLVNNMLVDNQVGSGGFGAGIGLTGADARLLHTTIARNTGGNGQGIFVAANAAAALTNTILVSHTVGIQAGGPATMTATLWGEGVWLNETPWSGSVSTGTLNYWGDPDFVEPDNIDYHVSTDSAAIGKGVPTFVTTDIDGELRRGSPTLGADEMFLSVYLPLVLRNN
jgi:parallel beta-helix repeat protein